MSDTSAAPDPQAQTIVHPPVYSFTIGDDNCGVTLSPRSGFIQRFLQALVGIEWRVKQ